MSVNEELLKSVLVDIVKFAGTTTIATECGVDFDSNECEAGACEYFYDCARQRRVRDDIQIIQSDFAGRNKPRIYEL